jgi:hypothetical protein
MTQGVVTPIGGPRIISTPPGFIGTPIITRPVTGITRPINFGY